MFGPRLSGTVAHDAHQAAPTRAMCRHRQSNEPSALNTKHTSCTARTHCSKQARHRHRPARCSPCVHQLGACAKDRAALLGGRPVRNALVDGKGGWLMENPPSVSVATDRSHVLVKNGRDRETILHVG